MLMGLYKLQNKIQEPGIDLIEFQTDVKISRLNQTE